jgi:hypothetical protein
VSQVASVRVSVIVALDPAVAFIVFTDDIGEWYRSGLSTMVGHERPETLRFEGGVGGRLLEVDRVDGIEREQARVTVWEPGERLVFVDGRETEVDVRFEAIARGTRVVLEHRGLDRLRPDVAESVSKHSWKRLAGWFEQHVEASAAPTAPNADGRRPG